MGEIQLLSKEACLVILIWTEMALSLRKCLFNFSLQVQEKNPWSLSVCGMEWDNTGREKNSYINIWMVLCNLPSALACNYLIWSWRWGEMRYVLPPVTSKWPGWTSKLGFFPQTALLLNARPFLLSEWPPKSSSQWCPCTWFSVHSIPTSSHSTVCNSLWNP